MMKKQRSNQENRQEIKNLVYFSREEVVSNEDLITEILLRVPAKSLIRFKCVSKAWLSLISDPDFSSNHARRNSNSLVSGFYFYYRTLGLTTSNQLRSISLLNKIESLPNFNFFEPNPSILDACNGLILCSNEFGLFKKEGGYTVCNPTTRTYKRILDPYSIVEGPDERFSLLNPWYQEKNIRTYDMSWLAFDASISNQYKIIRLVHTDRTEVNEIEIYSSENSSWKSISITTVKINNFYSKQVYWHKTLNWVTQRHVHIRFDVENEKLTSAPLGKITENHDINHFGSCHGNLILVTCNLMHQSYKDPFINLTVLEMKSNNNSWVATYRINIQQYILWEVIGLYVVDFANRKNGDEALLLSVITKQDRDKFHRESDPRRGRGRLISVRSNSMKIQVLDHLHSGETRDNFFNFFETLSPV